MSKICAHFDLVIFENALTIVKFSIAIGIVKVVQTNRNLFFGISNLRRSQRVNMTQHISVFIGFIYALIYQTPFTRGRSVGTISAIISEGHVLTQVFRTDSSTSFIIQPFLYIVWQGDEISRFRQPTVFGRSNHIAFSI